MHGQKLHSNLKNFLNHLEVIRDTLPMVLLSIRPYFEKVHEDMESFIKNKAQIIEQDNEDAKIAFNYKDIKQFKSLDKNLSLTSLSPKLIYESLFVSLISQYDAFLTNLLRTIFEIKPEILNSSEKNLTFSQLVNFENIEKAREHIIEKEIETVLRKNHAEHFAYLERILDIKLKVNLKIWPTFIEITERRNLFVHCDGIVSSQYLSVCASHDYNTGKLKVGNRLKVNLDYFQLAHRCLYELSVKLTHTVWRKLLSTDLEEADKKLNEICYDLIVAKSYSLSNTLLDFGAGQRNHFNDITKNLFIINKALSKYLQDKKEECNEILSNKDWSATSDDFKLAHKILIENYEEAYTIMKRIGNNGLVGKPEYTDWPIFTKICEEEKFKQVYKEIFEEDFVIVETPMRLIQEIIKKESTDIKKDTKELKLKNKSKKSITSKTPKSS